jgi:hypothetical protein
MPYALIPDGYSLKQVTKLQKEAVNAKRRHDDFVAFLSNSNTPIVIGGLVAGFFAARTAATVIEELEKDLGALSDSTKETITDAVAKVEKEVISDPANWLEKKLTGAKAGIEEKLSGIGLAGLA